IVPGGFSGIIEPGARPPAQSVIRCFLGARLSRASRRVKVEASDPAGPIRREEKRRSVGGDVGLRFVVNAVHRSSEIQRSAPWIGHSLAGGDPQVGATKGSGTVRPKEQLESVEANDGALLIGGAAQFIDKLCDAKRTVGLLGADIDIGPPG